MNDIKWIDRKWKTRKKKKWWWVAWAHRNQPIIPKLNWDLTLEIAFSKWIFVIAAHCCTFCAHKYGNTYDFRLFEMRWNTLYGGYTREYVIFLLFFLDCLLPFVFWICHLMRKFSMSKHPWKWLHYFCDRWSTESIDYYCIFIIIIVWMFWNSVCLMRRACELSVSFGTDKAKWEQLKECNLWWLCSKGRLNMTISS